ncbi:Dabb family protein [Salinibacterium sp. G-O1]|uniref:Dabb family protein n=1 Tax=Salinibacterium sp. G-O1 TaxID=3046208 RepID=UPI0024BB63A7|nr:Dabb family protein [Salinibacterium sp. G-O1]MDJ0336357.1 Dabb family protein [Salinibacterium sp. G-O1]
MIRHIVTWKLKAQDDAGKADAVAAIAGALEPLVDVIPGIQSLVVRPNVAYFGSNWDVLVMGDYDSLDALETYMTHPDHVTAAAVVREHASDRAAIDFEL